MHSEYIEQRNGGYYVAGTRISLDSVVYSFNEGQSSEAIQKDFPSLKRAATSTRRLTRSKPRWSEGWA